MIGYRSRCFILALVERDDGERLLLGDGGYEFTSGLLHFAANTYTNDVIEVQGNDGTLLAGQVRRAATQSFDGFVGDATCTFEQTEQLRTDFIAFFRKNHYYRVIYIFPNGSAIQRRRGYIVDAPAVQELYQIFPSYHVALGFEDVNYYRYLENEAGEEIYGGTAIIPTAASATLGGVIWDDLGATWDEVGTIWEAGAGPTGAITVDSEDYTYPIWTVTGLAQNPTLENTTTGQLITFEGTVTATQTLVVDMLNKTMQLNGTNVVDRMSGSWLALMPGNNDVIYSTSNGGAPDSKLEWQEIVG